MIAAPPPAVERAALLAGISAVRSRRLALALGHGALVAAGVGLAMLAGEMVLDWCADLPWMARAAWLAAMLGAVGMLAYRRLFLPWRRAPDDDAAALMIERAEPAFRGRFIAAVQLTRADRLASNGLVRALVAQTAAVAAAHPRYLRAAASAERLQRALRATGPAALLAIGLAAWSGESGLILFRRALLSREPAPTKTRVVEVTGDRVVGVGDDVLVGATALGLVPRAGQLEVTGADNRREVLPLDPEPAQPRRFSRRVARVQESFAYAVNLGDGRSQLFHVTARPRPAVTALECREIYPAYTHLGERPVKPNDLQLLAGSRLRLRCRASTPIRAASAQLTGPGNLPAVPMRAVGLQELEAEIPIPAQGVDGFAIVLVDTAGVEARSPAVYRIDVRPDQPPTVAINYPDRREELATAQARLLIGFTAADDFGLARVTLHYRTAGKDKDAPEHTVELDAGAGGAKGLQRRYEWQLSSLTPPPELGGGVEFWLEAADANDMTGPGIARSEHFTARIVSAQDKLADLFNRAHDTLGGLDSTADRQQEINRQIGTLIQEKPR